jgi:hypothetical protein
MVRFHLYEIVKIIETEGRMVVARCYKAKEIRGSLFNEYRLSILQNEKSSGDVWW